MKPFLTIIFIFSMNILLAQAPKGFDYTIILGGCFDQDEVSMTVNNRVLFKNYLVNNRDQVTRGNLSLVQNQEGIHINYNGNELERRSVPFEFILNIKLTVNRQVTRFTLDLRKGNIILVDYCPDPEAQPLMKKLTTEQLQEPFLFME